MKYKLIAQGTNCYNSLSKELKHIGKQFDVDRLDVAVAYATLPGIKVIESALDNVISSSRWIIGLDDAISQPEALKYLLNKKNTEVRIAKMTPTKRFHPKLYCIWSSMNNSRFISAIGSGNMTLNGLRNNGEVAVLLSAETEDEAYDLRSQWLAMWKLGNPLTEKIITEYSKQYKQGASQRKKLSDAGISPPEPDPHDFVGEESEFDGDPSKASIAWLEAGSASAGGRDLEFPKQMMPFFRLQKSPSQKVFEMKPGALHNLTFTKRLDNQMWRLLFSNDAIQDCVGRNNLRPLTGGNRSDLAIVFLRTNGKCDFQVRMLPIDGAAFKKLVKQSESVNGLFSTRNPGGRSYGFF